MKRDVVAPMRKAKIPIPAAPTGRHLRQAAGNSNLKNIKFLQIND